MIPPRWLSFFILGAGFGYGLALFIHPERTPIAVSQPKIQPAAPLQHPVSPVVVIQNTGQQQLEPKSKPLEAPDHAISEEAYIALIREAVVKREFSMALNLLSEAEQQFDVSATRLMLLAEIQWVRKNFRGARETLHHVLEVDPATTAQVYPMLREVVTALIGMQEDALTFDEKVQMLSQEIIDDPGFSTYYILLGRLYYEHADYAEAITNLEYALQLDYTQAATLSPLIRAAKQRLDSPGLVELPITSHGRALNVDVQLNDIQQSFHFILDTGASHTAISTRTAQKLGIVISQDLPTIQVSTANGMVTAPVVTLNAVNLKGALVEQVPAMILSELNGFDGLLGLSFLNHFNIDINQDEGKLFLLKPSAKR